VKQGAEDHGKFKILARLLKIPLPYANGIMERLWLKAGQYRPDGAVGRWSNVEIAEYCGMPIEFDPDALVAAMIESRFLDREDGPTRLLVHDWPEHCTHFIHNKLARKSAYFANGSPPSLKRLDHRYKAEAEAFYGVSAQSDKVSAQSDKVSAQSDKVSAQSNKARKQTDVGVSAQKGKMSAQSTPNARARPTPTPKPTPKPTPGVATPLVAADSFLQQQRGHFRIFDQALYRVLPKRSWLQRVGNCGIDCAYRPHVGTARKKSNRRIDLAGTGRSTGLRERTASRARRSEVLEVRRVAIGRRDQRRLRGVL
jgi:hypothetical protein